MGNSCSAILHSKHITVKRDCTFEAGMLSPVGEHVVLDVFVQSFRHLVEVLEVVRLFSAVAHVLAGLFEGADSSSCGGFLNWVLTHLLQNKLSKI